MTDAGTALLSHILDEPDRDDHRLVYADWLEEQDTAESLARAEFVRLQIRIDTLSSARDVPALGGEEYDDCTSELIRLRNRERTMLTRHWREWCPEVVSQQPCLVSLDLSYLIRIEMADKITVRLMFIRGFINWLSCTCSDWYKRGPAICRAHPIKRVEIVDRDPAGTDAWNFDDGSWSPDEDDDRFLLPWEWYDHFPHAEEFNGPKYRRRYRDRDAAIAARDAGALAWAKAEARKGEGR